MNKIFRLTFLIFSLGLFAGGSPVSFLGGSLAYAGAPKSITYQGTLRKAGAIYTGAVPMEFRITNADGSVIYWASGSTAVYVTAGLFRYPLGTPNEAQFAAIPWSSASPYIRVIIDGATLPADPLLSTPYALHSGTAEGSAGSFVLADGDLRISTTTGNRGIVFQDGSTQYTAAVAPLTMSGDVTMDNAGVTAIGAGKVTAGMIMDGAITAADIAPAAISLDKLDRSGCAENQIPKWNGSAWACAVDIGVGSDIYWNGTATGLDAAAGRASLGLGALAGLDTITESYISGNISASKLSGIIQSSATGTYPLSITGSAATAGSVAQSGVNLSTVTVRIEALEAKTSTAAYLSATQTFTGANVFAATAAFTAVNATLPGVDISSGLIVRAGNITVGAEADTSSKLGYATSGVLGAGYAGLIIKDSSDNEVAFIGDRGVIMFSGDETFFGFHERGGAASARMGFYSINNQMHFWDGTDYNLMSISRKGATAIEKTSYGRADNIPAYLYVKNFDNSVPVANFVRSTAESAIYIADSGNVGIGTVAPATKLHVSSGVLTIDGAGAGIITTGALTASNLSGSNTGDNAVNTLYSGLVTNAAHTGDATGDTALTVKQINGVALSGLATGILKNTTATGVPSIAIAGTDYLAPTGNGSELSGIIQSSATGTYPLSITGSAATAGSVAQSGVNLSTVTSRIEALEAKTSTAAYLSSTQTFTGGNIFTGNVGIGEAAPAYMLDVLGTTNFPVKVKGSSGGGFILGAYNNQWGGLWSAGVTPSITNYSFITHPTFGLAFNAPTGGSLQFDINDVVKMYLTANGGLNLGYNTTATAAGSMIISGNVGIGTVAPATKLHVSSGVLTVDGTGAGIITTGNVVASSGAAAAPAYGFGGDLDTGIYSSGANSVSVSAGGSEKMRIFSNGNMAFDDFTNMPLAASNSTYKVFHFASPTNNGSTILSMASRNKSTSFFGNYTGTFVIGNEGTYPIDFKTNLVYWADDIFAGGTTVMRITGAGNVGIGTVSPATKLHVSSGVLTVDGTGAGITTTGDVTATTFIGSGTSLTGVLQLSSTHTFTGANTFASTAAFTAVNATLPGVDISSGLIVRAGNVGIGTSSPRAALEVVGQVKITGGTPGLNKVLTSDADGLATWGPPASGSGTPGGSDTQIQYNNGSAFAGDSGLVYKSGNVGIGTANPIDKLHIDGGADPSFIHFTNTASGQTVNDGLRIGMRNDATGAEMIVNDGYFTITTGGNTRMQIQSDGSIGIGTIAPATKLHVSSGVLTVDGTGAGITTTGNVTATTFIGSGASLTGVTQLASTQTFTGANAFASTTAFTATNATLPGVDVSSGLIVRAGNVGIGTAAPSAKIHTLSITEQLRLGYDDLNYLSATVGSAGIATFNTAGTAPGFSFTGGNVGIGIPPDVSASNRPALQIIKSGVISQLFIGSSITNTTTKTASLGIAHYNSGWVAFDAIHGTSNSTANIVDFGGGGSNAAATNINFYTAGNASTVGGTNRMNVDSSGNVGIGAAVPATKLHVSSGVLTVDGTGAGIATTGNITAANLSGSNTGDNAVNTLYSGLVTNATHTGDVTGSTALTIVHVPGAAVDLSTVTTRIETLEAKTSTAAYLASTQTFTGANTFGSTAAFTATHATLPGVDISSGLIVRAGNVGIGITTPDNPLSIYFNSNVTSIPGVKLKNANSGGKALFTAANDAGVDISVGVFGSSFGAGLANMSLIGGSNGVVIMTDGGVSGGGTNSIQFRTSGYNAPNERMRIDNLGNVGIGTVAPATKLHVSSGVLTVDGTGAGITTTGNITAATFIGSGASLTGVPQLSSTQTFTGGNTFTGNTGIYGVTVSSNVSLAGALYTQNGKVGIGTANPSELLEVNPGASYAGYPSIKIVSSYADGYNASLILKNAHTGGQEWWMRAGNNASGGIYSNLQIYQTGVGPRFDITAAGNIGIGTTAPAARLTVISTGTMAYSLAVGTSTAYSMVISTAGNVGIGTTAPGAPLEVYRDDTTNTLPTSIIRGGNNHARLRFIVRDSGDSISEIYKTVSDYSFNFYTAPSYNNSGFNFYTAQSATVPKLSIKNDGTVGIGTTAPAAGLDVISGTSVAYSLAVGTSAASYQLAVSTMGVVTIGKYTVTDKGTDPTTIALTVSDFGNTFISTGTGNSAQYDLPSVTAADIGAQFTFVKLGSGKVTIHASDSAYIADSGAGGTIYNDSTMETYASITLRLVTDTKWIIIGGDGNWMTTTN